MEPEAPEWWLTWNTLTYANPDVYGPLVGNNTIQEAFYSTLWLWLPAYIHEFNRNLGGNILKVPKEYRVKPENRSMPEEPEAAILVVCPGTARKPETHSHDTRAVWQVEVGVQVAGGSSWQETAALTGAYGVAVRAAILQHRSLEGVAETTEWTGETYLEKEHTPTRTSGVMIVKFECTTSSTIDIYAGPPSPQFAGTDVPTIPSILPPPNAPNVESVTVTVEGEAP